VLGKVCPYCGKAGAVLCETTQRIIYECPNAHQYEKRKHLETHREEPH
jgi:exosome complex RNA-binding protein Csl4